MYVCVCIFREQVSREWMDTLSNVESETRRSESFAHTGAPDNFSSYRDAPPGLLQKRLLDDGDKEEARTVKKKKKRRKKEFHNATKSKNNIPIYSGRLPMTEKIFNLWSTHSNFYLVKLIETRENVCNHHRC